MKDERTHDTDSIWITLTSKASLGELLEARQFIQAEIDSKTPKLEEPDVFQAMGLESADFPTATTQQTGPVQVVESEPVEPTSNGVGIVLPDWLDAIIR